MKFDRQNVAWIVTGAALLAASLCLADRGISRDKPYVSPGKPSAPIDMSYSLREEPAAGIPLTIDVAISSRVRADELTLDINFPDSGLTLVSAPDAQPVTEPDAGEPHARSIRVLPREEGEFHVNVVATLVRNGVAQTRAFSIPVRVGILPSSSAGTARLKIDASGRALISLPATESGTGL